MKDYDEDLTINKKRPIRLLWVGGIWPRKGLKVLIDALHNSCFNITREYQIESIDKIP